MELKIYNPQEEGFLQKIDWNFEELKKEITVASEEYAVSVYTDDAIKAAKADRAKLNKFVDAMEAKRKELKKKVMVPYEQFEKEEKELVAIVQRAIDNIDAQVKDYERRQREEKAAKIRDFYDANINDLEAYLPFERVFKPEYANAATTMKSVREEIAAMIQKVAEGLAILNEVDSPYAGDMKEVFLRTYDIGLAIAERNRLEAAEQKRKEYEAERTKAKAEQKARRKAEAQVVMAAGRKQEEKPAEPTAPAAILTPTVETVEEPLHVLDFRVYATSTQLAGLKQYLKTNGIRFEPAPKQ